MSITEQSSGIGSQCLATTQSMERTLKRATSKRFTQQTSESQRERYCYILTYSFPCQDLSLAGKQRGMSKGKGTRSGLLWEVERILDECEGNLPQVLLMENVPQVVGTKNIGDFQLWRRKLESLGYSNYVQLLNSKDYGIPQNRNRCFMVSLLGDWHYSFPKKQKLELRLKDMLEDEVDEKYYLSDEMVQYFIANNEKQKEKGNGFRFDPFERERERVAKTINCQMARMENEFVKESDSLTREQENINQTRSSLIRDAQEQYRQPIGKIRNSLNAGGGLSILPLIIEINESESDEDRRSVRYRAEKTGRKHL